MLMQLSMLDEKSPRILPLYPRVPQDIFPDVFAVLPSRIILMVSIELCSTSPRDHAVADSRAAPGIRRAVNCGKP